MSARKIIERLIANYAAGRMDEAFADCADDFRFHWVADPATARNSARGVDRAGMRERLEQLHARYDYLEYRPIMIVAEGDHVAVQVALRLRDKASGSTIEMTVGDFWTVRDGRIVELVEYYDTATVQALEGAAGA